MRPTTSALAIVAILASAAISCDGTIAVDDDDDGGGSVVIECGEPEILPEPVNSEHSEAGPALSPDGLTLLFSSDRPGGEGDSDLWTARRSALGEPWGDPVNLGPPVNTPGGQNNPALSPDGTLLVYGANAAGNYDLWAAEAAGDGWSDPWRIEELASDALENKPALTPDGAALYFKRSDSSLDADVWFAARQGEGWSDPVLVPGINDDRSQTDPAFSPEGDVLFFAQGDDTEAPADIHYAVPDGDGGWRDVRMLPGVNQAGARDEAFTMGPDGSEALFVSDRGEGGDRDIYTVRCERR